MIVQLLGFWIWCLLGTRFPSTAGEISSQLREELNKVVAYDPCYRWGTKRNRSDCRHQVLKFEKIPINDRGPCRDILTCACRFKTLEFDDKCKVWVTGPGMPSKTMKPLNWCVKKALDPTWEEPTKKFWRNSTFKRQNSGRG